MKKLIFGVILIIAVSVACLLYLKNNTASGAASIPNIYLTTLNYAVQIGYNILYLIVALAVLYVANHQLNKTREATTIQTLTNIATTLKSEPYFKNRTALAVFILGKGKDNCGVFHLKIRLDELKELSMTNEIQSEEIAIIKNKFEAVIYDFEILSYYHKKGIYSIEDIYQLFSYEIQRFWLLVTHLGFIDYLRYNKANGEDDFYDKFEALFDHTIKYEIIKAGGLKFSDRLFYKVFSIDRLFKCERRSMTKKIVELKKRKAGTLDIFLLEEKHLANCGNSNS